MEKHVSAVWSYEGLSVNHTREDIARAESVVSRWLILLDEDALPAGQQVGVVLQLARCEFVERSLRLLKQRAGPVRFASDVYDDVVGKVGGGKGLEPFSELSGDLFSVGELHQVADRLTDGLGRQKTNSKVDPKDVLYPALTGI